MLRYAIICFVAVNVPAAFAEENIMGRMMGQTCAGCHGTNGAPAVRYIPPLAGMKQEDFIKAMVVYRDGTRRATIMDRVAHAFSDAEFSAMADYFAALPAAPLAPAATGMFE
jgi:sulfide dehydrogenase cytochrome subunit